MTSYLNERQFKIGLRKEHFAETYFFPHFFSFLKVLLVLLLERCRWRRCNNGRLVHRLQRHSARFFIYFARSMRCWCLFKYITGLNPSPIDHGNSVTARGFYGFVLLKPQLPVKQLHFGVWSQMTA